MALNFDVSNVINQLSEDFTVTSVTRVLNNRGDATETETDYDITGVVEFVSGPPGDSNAEGKLLEYDTICFFDENADNAEYLLRDNYLKISGSTYKIREVVTNKGHIEIHAKKIL